MSARDHNQGNQGRSYTPEQKAAVLRIRRCQATAFYEILELQKTCSDGEIKKAYRKQSLLTHPDKNGHEHADEAFKMVSRAFGVLGDKEKREKFDRYGTDPDSRFESARAQASNPFAGGGGFGGGGGGFGGARAGGWEDEISPEEMFARFFGGGFGGGGFDGPFGGGPQFVFNLGGQRGFRVHQMGGAGPRRRPREAGNGEAQGQRSGWETFIGLLPILFFLLFPILTSLFSGGDSQPAMPKMAFDVAQPPLTFERATPNYRVKYFVNPNDVAGWTDYKLQQMDKEAEDGFLRSLQRACELERRTKQRLVDDAQGWFFEDPDKMKLARDFEMANCKRIDKLQRRRR
ncbi:DnaJ domain-containing protein [Microdochium bolleyi]|uniref:DnaJ domain-containing protein n=1 Tax=Microdochium bolleyi TaxID=196109 RepID=A0A136JHQ3_9PEZI|nr:DnaJ domain-containing protein [Microdochium bolleyi]